MDRKMQNGTMDALFDTILKLKSREECYDFFDDLCTVKELQAMAQRLEVAKMLSVNKTYTQISEKTGASTVTISRVNRILNYGNDSLKAIIDEANKES
jgi:TrpR-related protein YerC/YecD